MEVAGLLCALLEGSCHLVQGWGGDRPGHQVGGMGQGVHESMLIPPPGLSLCKKCGEILLRKATE